MLFHCFFSLPTNLFLYYGTHDKKNAYICACKDTLYNIHIMANHRHAYLIMAHNEWQLLNTLLSLIDDERNDIFLHIDKKVKEMPQLYKPLHAKLFFTPKRYDVRWGDVGQVLSEMHLFKTAHNHGPYQYYHKLSGVDLPIKTQDYIHDFFDKHEGKEFIGFFTLTDFIKGDIERKRRRYYLLMKYNYRTPFVAKWKVMAAKLIRHAALKIQDWIHYDRGNELTFRTGHNWVSLTEEAVTYLLDNEDFISKRFAYTTCGDEMYKHSMLISNPKFKERIFDLDNGIHSCMRFIDFLRASEEQQKRGEPYNWQDDDAEELLKSEYLFARKFSSKYPKVIKDIEEYLKRGTGK